MKQLQWFIERLQTAQSIDQQREVLQNFLEASGFRYYSYYIDKPDGAGGLSRLPAFVTSYPDEWVKRYANQSYLRHDPLVIEAPRRRLPFRWSDVAQPKDLDSRQKVLFSEAADFHIANGLTIPIHGRDGEFAALYLVADGSAAEQARIIEQQAHLGHLVAMYWHSLAGVHLLECGANQTRDGDGATSMPVLTDRERQVLTWVSRGKSTWDIANILSLSERTVTFHIDNARKKLVATTRTHLVVKAIMEGLIDP